MDDIDASASVSRAMALRCASFAFVWPASQVGSALAHAAWGRRVARSYLVG
jgi:hypothetical protein